LSGQGHAGALDPFRHANAIRDGLPEAVTVFDAFHLVRLGTQVVDRSRTPGPLMFVFLRSM
jgi:hypothetical protein